MRITRLGDAATIRIWCFCGMASGGGLLGCFRPEPASGLLIHQERMKMKTLFLAVALVAAIGGASMAAIALTSHPAVACASPTC
jgi:hypothetical protein